MLEVLFKKKKKIKYINNEMAINSYLPMIILNTSTANTPIKRDMEAEWITKQDPCECCLQETHLRWKDSHRVKVKGQKMIFSESENRQKYQKK